MTNLLDEFIKIQKEQLALDQDKKKLREVTTKVRSRSQKIPQMIRDLPLK